ncbi:MAG: lysoplasmalogenase [Candidatus Saccharicenans sp.]
MNLNIAAFVISILVSAGAAIAAEARNQKFLSYFFRPFTIILMLGLLFEARPWSFYRNTIMIGLGFCLLGEMMMMLRKKKFLIGLTFFLVALLVFSAAFFSRLSSNFWKWPVIPLVLLATVILYLIWPNLRRIKVPVVFYFMALLTMTRLALEFPHQIPGDYRAWLTATGGFLFLLSDALLALNRFYRPFRQAQIFILSSFYLALLLITLSV